MVRIFALTDSNGLAAGFWRDDLHAADAIPPEAIEIDEATWLAWIADTHRQRWNAETGSLVPYDPPPPPPVVPSQITRRQMLLALAEAGLITPEEALAAATTGAVPAVIDVIFAQLPAADALAARITWATMSVAERDHPLIGALIAAELATPAEVDALFVQAAGM